MTATLTPHRASQFARLTLGHVTRRWPHALQHVLLSESDLVAPDILHPVFHGSFDWHSCVHGYWLLARLMRRMPQLPEATQITALMDAQLTPEKISHEVTYFNRPAARGFERPYGWAWLLMLSAELARHTGSSAQRWTDALNPLADLIAARFRTFLPLAHYPVRAGTHGNTAFALLLTIEYATVARAPDLAQLCHQKARQWYQHDSNCPAWEPCLNDFLSPALVEAALMSRVLNTEEFPAWFDRFLPGAASGHPATLFTPVQPPDRTDGQMSHLDGLNFSRAWCWRLIWSALPESHALKGRLAETIAKHIEASLPHLQDDYMGEHWLATFALLAMDEEPKSEHHTP